jgi:hypothetical protein
MDAANAGRVFERFGKQLVVESKGATDHEAPSYVSLSSGIFVVCKYRIPAYGSLDTYG